MTKNQLIDILTRNIEFDVKLNNHIREAAVWGGLVFAILFFLRPFGLSNSDMLYLFVVCLGFGVATFLPFLINLAFTKKWLYKRFNKSWYLKYNLVLYLIILPQVCFLNLLYSGLVIDEFAFNISGFFRLSYYTALLYGIIASFRIVITLAARYNNEVVVLNTKLEYYKELSGLNPKQDEITGQLELNFDSDKLRLVPGNIVLITAWGNYIKILVQADNRSVELVKRGRMNDVEQQLSTYSVFIRCHRSFIVNLNFIKQIKGTAKRSDAVLTVKELRIPIARSQIKILRNRWKENISVNQQEPIS